MVMGLSREISREEFKTRGSLENFGPGPRNPKSGTVGINCERFIFDVVSFTRLVSSLSQRKVASLRGCQRFESRVPPETLLAPFTVHCTSVLAYSELDLVIGY